MSPEDVKTIVELIIQNKIKYFWLYMIFSVFIGMASTFLYQYLRVKGQNLATKSDIDELTKTVESIKYDYLKKIEEYKKDLSSKFEIEKTLIDSKKKTYQIATSLKVAILKRKNNMGNEKELNQQLFDQIPELLIHIHSHFQLRKELDEEIRTLEKKYNDIVLYKERIKTQGKQTYTINLEKIEDVIDSIQKKLLK